MKVLVTGAAGFIGAALSRSLLKEKAVSVVGLDSLNDYYDPQLKQNRLKLLADHPQFTFHKIDICDKASLLDLFKKEKFHRVIHLAAQAGVRYSISNPEVYAQSNLIGFLNILEACRENKVEHLVYASTSSVYGLNEKLPFHTDDSASHPVSFYAATKRANELMAHSYSSLYKIPTTGLRFFTVYGPWGRPDMAFFKFTRQILAGEPIEVFNEGHHARDFTYIDDIVEGIQRVSLASPPTASKDWSPQDPKCSTSSAPYRLYNIGNNQSTELLRAIEVLEKLLGKKAEKKLLPMQPGDVAATHADVKPLIQNFGYSPSTTIEVGLKNFVEWYRSYYSD
ncbi:MAG: NAD-dependent epimerase [Bradymonadales bacterium]|nr:MAG: NAD-dependent epimerase [Bradymonadales bacterium]